MSGNLGLLFLICWPIIGGIVTYMMGKKKAESANDMADIVAFVQCVVFAAICYLTMNQSTVEFKVSGFAGLTLTLRTDLFRSILGLIVTVCFAVAGIFTKKQSENMKNVGRYQMFMLFTMGMAGGMMLSAGISAAFTFLQLMMLSVFPLIAHDETEGAIKAASQYLVAAVAGGLVSLIGLVRLLACVGSLSLDTFYAGMMSSSVTSDVVIACAFLVVGFLVQAGVIVLGFWTKKTTEHTPDTALMCIMNVCTRVALMGAIMLTCNLMLKENEWGAVILVIGLLTLVVSGFLSLFAKNLKNAISWLSIAVTAFLVVGLGVMSLGGVANGETASGTVILFVSGMVGMMVLFMVYAVVNANCESTDINTIRGFGKKKPVLMIGYLLAACNIAGVPFFGGFQGYALIKEGFNIYIQYENNSVASMLAKFVMIFGLALIVAVVVKLYVVLFVDKNDKMQDVYNEVKRSGMDTTSAMAIIIMAVVPVVCGILSDMTYGKLVALSETTFRNEGIASAALLGPNYFVPFGIYFGIGILCYVVFVLALGMKKTEEGRMYR